MSDEQERKNAQIDSIRKKNERALTDMKNYYNDITLNNLAMISTLKEEIKTKEDRLERNEQLLSSVQQVKERQRVHFAVVLSSDSSGLGGFHFNN